MRPSRPPLPLLFGAAALALVPWSGSLLISLPCHYAARHWGIAWAGFDTGLALALSLTAVGALRRAPWLDRAAVAAATLLTADAWFDVVTSRGAVAVAFAMTEALAIEMPLALVCIWVAQTPTRPRDRLTTATTDQQGALQ
jgi:hypothetical protein